MRSTFNVGRAIAILAAVGLVGCGARITPSPLTAAAAAGNAEEVRRLLAAGTPPDAVDPSGQTALMVAARNDRVEVIRVLVAAGADVNAPDHRMTRWPPLVHAIHKGREGAATALLQAGADPNAHDRAGATPLMYAAAYGNLALVRKLLARGADPRAATTDGVTALWAAAGGGGLFDLSDGPAIGTCYPEIVDAILERAPELRVRRAFSNRIIHAFAGASCDALLKRLEADRP